MQAKTYTQITVSPITGASVLARMGGRQANLPQLFIDSPGYPATSVEISLAGHDDPERWLSELIAAATELRESLARIAAEASDLRDRLGA